MQRTILITGANRGLGLATAGALAKQGHHVILAARTQEKAQAAAAPLLAEERKVTPVACDVSSQSSIDAAVKTIASLGLAVDVLINNAGALSDVGGFSASPLHVEPAVLIEAFNTNTVGAYTLIQKLLPGMNERGYGRVVNISSGMGGIAEMEGKVPSYRISKAAMNAVTKLFAAEAIGNVKVNSVCPGWVRTDMGGANATRGLDEGIAGIVWAATLPDGGPSGGFFRDGKPIPW